MTDEHKYIGIDKPVVDHVKGDPHWSEMPKPVTKKPDYPSWYDSDNNAQSPLEADLEDNEL